jgi:HEPN domain-containing protein
MKDETRIWLSYADENLDVSALTLEHGHLNACLQNAQQATEKYLKAVILERNLPFQRTHSVRELVRVIAADGLAPKISEDEIDLMDAIYIPSKYPAYSALPQAIPDPAICNEALSVARKVRDLAHGMMKLGELG